MQKNNSIIEAKFLIILQSMNVRQQITQLIIQYLIKIYGNIFFDPVIFSLLE